MILSIVEATGSMRRSLFWPRGTISHLQFGPLLGQVMQYTYVQILSSNYSLPKGSLKWNVVGSIECTTWTTRFPPLPPSPLPIKCAPNSNVACVAQTSIITEYLWAYHFLKIEEVTIITSSATSLLQPSKQHCKVITNCSEGEVGTGRGPSSSGGRDGPLPCRKWNKT